MERSRLRARNVIGIAIIAILIFGTGFLIGEAHAIGLFTKLGLKVLHAQNISIDINAQQLAKGIFQYQNNIANLP